MGEHEAMAVRFRLREQLEQVRPPMRQAELARISGVSANTINAVVNNNTRQVSLETLNRLCNALRCEPGDLLAYEPDVAPRRGRKPA